MRLLMAIVVACALASCSGAAGASQAATPAAAEVTASPAAAATPATAAPSPTPALGKWVASSSKDELTGEDKLFANLTADSGESRFGKPFTLIMRCSSGKFEAYIAWSDYIGLETAQVSWRVDDKPITTETWGLSTDGTATFSHSPAQLLAALGGGTEFVARVTPYSDSAITAVFDVTGTRTAVAPVATACGLNP